MLEEGEPFKISAVLAKAQINLCDSAPLSNRL